MSGPQGTWFRDPGTVSWTLPESFRSEDVRLSETVIARYIERFTEAGDGVFDPFLGFGTTLVVASRLKRTGFGVEIDETRAAYAASLFCGEVTQGDVRDVDLSALPDYQLCLSSPPYMNRDDPEDPLSGYQSPVASYAQFIEQLANNYVRCGQHLADTGKLVIQLQNLRNQTAHTPLVHDLQTAIGDRLTLVNEEVLLWDQPSYGYDHGVCLVYAV